MSERRLHIGLIFILATVFVWSFIKPHDYFTWFLEVLPAILGTGLLAALYNRFKFTPVVYGLMAFFMCILMVGGHYTYAQVPIGNWTRDAFHLPRNHFDRMGHFFQGVIPAMAAREILLRKTPLKPGGWLLFICTCIALAISACYEFFEWGTSVATGTKADDFLGTQGDVWDTQWDMFMAMNGAWISQVLLSGIQDRQLKEMESDPLPVNLPYAPNKRNA